MTQIQTLGGFPLNDFLHSCSNGESSICSGFRTSERTSIDTLTFRGADNKKHHF